MRNWLSKCISQEGSIEFLGKFLGNKSLKLCRDLGNSFLCSDNDDEHRRFSKIYYRGQSSLLSIHRYFPDDPGGFAKYGKLKSCVKCPWLWRNFLAVFSGLKGATDMQSLQTKANSGLYYHAKAWLSKLYTFEGVVNGLSVAESVFPVL